VIRRFLELNKTSETLDFHVIPGAVPNRGLNPQSDLMLYGLHYLQRVADDNPPDFVGSGDALHIEPGFFMNVPASQVPPNGPTIVRLASIPHGVTVVMQGNNPGTTPTPKAPKIPAIYPIPGLPLFSPASPALGLGIQPTELMSPAGIGRPNQILSPPKTAEHIVPEVNIANDVPGSQSNAPASGYPPEYQDYINDPNSVLRDAIAGQDILGFIQIDLSTVSVSDSIGNIPFLGLSSGSLRRCGRRRPAQRFRPFSDRDVLDRVGAVGARSRTPSWSRAREPRIRCNSGDQTFLARADIPAVAVLPDGDPRFRRSPLAARHRGDADA